MTGAAARHAAVVNDVRLILPLAGAYQTLIAAGKPAKAAITAAVCKLVTFATTFLRQLDGRPLAHNGCFSLRTPTTRRR